MSTIYCNSSNIGKLLEEINIGLNIGDEVEVERVYGQIIKVKKRRESQK